jgi:hypothetical protein
MRVVVLVDRQEIEEIGLLLAWPVEPDLVVPEGAVHALVPDVAQAVQGQLGFPFLQQDRLHMDVVRLGNATEVVDQPGHLQQVEGTIVAVAARVVVIPVDREHGDGDVDVGILVVDMGEGALEDFGGIAQKLELAGFHAKAVLSQRAHDLVHGLSRWLVVVEEVAAEQDHVDILSAGELHDLVKGAPAVILANGISLLKADMVIRRD